MTPNAKHGPTAGAAPSDAEAPKAPEGKPREVHIDLDVGFPVAGTVVKRVTMHRMTMKDRLDLVRTNLTMSVQEREAILFAALCSMSLADFEAIDEKDYEKVSRAFVKMSTRPEKKGYDDKPNPAAEIVVTLQFASKIGGAPQNTITLRRPKLRDRLNILRTHPARTEEEREVLLMGNLCMMAPEEVEGLDSVDYDELQAEYRRFTISAP